MRNKNSQFANLLTSISLGITLSAVHLFAEPCYALATSPINSHGVTKQTDGSYLISGRDAFLVLPMVASNTETNAQGTDKGLRLAISIKRNQENERTIPAEIFFKANHSGQALAFDPLYRLQFRLPSTQITQFILPVPDDVNLTGVENLRLDINACRGCLISIQSTFELASLDSLGESASTVVLSNDRVFNGAQGLVEDGLLVDLQNWKLHDLESFGDKLAVTGGDPFLISPVLDVDTSTLGGVLFEIEAPASELPIYDFQLFYSTEKHAFIERASSIMRLAGDYKSNNSSNPIRFFVPLNFLSSQAPTAQMLKQLRLDFARHSFIGDGSTIQGLWSLSKVQLISKQQLAKYKPLIPAQLVSTKRQRASGRQILFGIFKKITGDIGFTLGYVSLLILVVFITIRKFAIAKSHR